MRGNISTPREVVYYDKEFKGGANFCHKIIYSELHSTIKGCAHDMVMDEFKKYDLTSARCQDVLNYMGMEDVKFCLCEGDLCNAD